MNHKLPYSGSTLDRGVLYRRDPQLLEQARKDPNTVLVLFWRDRCLMSQGQPMQLRISDAKVEAVLQAAPTTVFLGHEGGHVRKCQGANCGKLLFPRIEPAVICLVENQGSPRKCLLGRPKGAAEGVYATLAGFAEIGESLEDAVRREIREEAGVGLERVVYQASQPWPFPAGLMVGFRAVAITEATNVDLQELEEARWFTREELIEKLAQDDARRKDKSKFRDSIERYLIESWLREPDLN
jgi:ADP-ribose pyrophosphatase YjhB (NUDIX family)